MTRSVANFSEVMDEEERQRRMQELQMVFTHIPIYMNILLLSSITYCLCYMLTSVVQIKADLGTARREYISTVDLPNKYRHVGLDQIEAIRAANIKGSKVQKIAQANRAQLNAWNSTYPVRHYSLSGVYFVSRLTESLKMHTKQLEVMPSWKIWTT